MNTRTGSTVGIVGCLTRRRGTRLSYQSPLDLLEQLESRTLASASGLLDPSNAMPSAHSVGSMIVGVEPLAAPSDLSASATNSRVSLTWSAAESRVASIVVLRSANNGATFTAVATLARTARGYNDSSVLSGLTYQYKLRVSAPSAPVGMSAAISVTTSILTPNSLSATISGANVALRWADSNRAGTSYLVFRSTNGTDFTQIATATAKSYVDTTGSRNTAYYYKVQGRIGSNLSTASNVANATTPDGTSAVTLATRYSSEVVLTSLSGNDAISVSQSGSTLSLVLNGQTFTRSAPVGGLFIYNRGGADTITIDASVDVRTTITSIGDGNSTISSGISSLNAWLDTTDTFTGSGVSHRISAFAGGVTKAVGAALAKPSDAGATFKANASLFGSGPDADDINQGSVGDCYFLASLAGFADTDTSIILNSAADLGDGTYVVQYMRSNAPVYVRVTNDLPYGGFGGYRYAHPGESGTIWAPIMEKAWAYFRATAHTYASISAGWMGEVYTALGTASSSFSIGSSDATFFNMVSSALTAGKAVTFGTSSAAPNLVRGHAYSLVGASRDGDGVAHFVVRNPWGVEGVAIEDAFGYASLTFVQIQANFTAGVRAT